MKNIKNIKRITPNPSIPERKFGVLLEGMDKKINLVLEGHGALDKKIDGLKEEFVEFKGEMRVFRDDTVSNFKTVFDYLSRIDDELKAIKSEIFDLKNKLFSKAEVSRLESLEKRVKEMETKLASYKK